MPIDQRPDLGHGHSSQASPPSPGTAPWFYLEWSVVGWKESLTKQARSTIAQAWPAHQLRYASRLIVKISQYGYDLRILLQTSSVSSASACATLTGDTSNECSVMATTCRLNLREVCLYMKNISHFMLQVPGTSKLWRSSVAAWSTDVSGWGNLAP